MTLCSSPGLEDTMALGDSAQRSFWMSFIAAWPSDILMAMGCSPDPRGIVKTLVTTWATDINLDLACGRTADLDVVLGSSLGPAVTTISSGSTAHPDQHVPLTP